MPEHASSFTIQSAQLPAQGGWSNPRRSWAIKQHLALTVLSAGAEAATAALDVGPLPLHMYVPRPGGLNDTLTPVREVKGVFENSAAAVSWFHTLDSVTNMLVVGAAAGVVSNTNPAIEPMDTVIAFGRLAPPIRLHFTDPAYDALRGANEGASIAAEALFSYPAFVDYIGDMHFVDFSDVPTDGANNAAAALTRLLNAIENGGGNTVRTNGSFTRTFSDCQFTGMNPSGDIWVRNTDIGAGDSQIPQSVISNTAARFRLFPGVFVRRTRYVRDIRRVLMDNEAIDTANQGSQPIRIRRVDFVPTASDWLFVIDGSPQLVRVLHPAGSDLRRADEVWNTLLVPMIRSVGGDATARNFAPIDDPAAVAGEALERSDRFAYLEYARFIQPVASATVITDFPQTDTGLL